MNKTTVYYLYKCWIIAIFVICSLFSNFLLAEEIGAVSLNGTYDFDEDGLRMFVTQKARDLLEQMTAKLEVERKNLRRSQSG